MELSEKIRNLRKEYGLTQTQLGEIAGVSDKAVSTWENGTKIPRMGCIAKICNHFNIKPSALLDDLNFIIVDADDDAPLFDSKNISAIQEQADRDSEQYRQEQTILECFRNVNEEGKAAILKYVKYIANDDEYKKCDTDIKNIKGA